MIEQSIQYSTCNTVRVYTLLAKVLKFAGYVPMLAVSTGERLLIWGLRFHQHPITCSCKYSNYACYYDSMVS